MCGFFDICSKRVLQQGKWKHLPTLKYNYQSRELEISIEFEKAVQEESDFHLADISEHKFKHFSYILISWH